MKEMNTINREEKLFDVMSGAMAYVDGSYNPYTKEFASGAVIILQNGYTEYLSEKFNDSKLARMRNVAGEIKASEMVMQYCMDNNIERIMIFHDYTGVGAWCTGQWKAKQDETKAYKRFYDKALLTTNIKFVKVKAHSGNPYNETADRLAKEALYQDAS